MDERNHRERLATGQVRAPCDDGATIPQPVAEAQHHPVVGDLTLAYESMDLTADAGLRLNAYTAEPATPAQEALDLLASWTATPRERPAIRPAD